MAINRKANKWLAFVALGILAISCNKTPLVDKQFTVPSAGWSIADTFAFEFDITDTVLPYNHFINIRHTGGYPYSNFFLFVQTTMPNNKVIRDTVECQLADKDGRWFGSGLGDLLNNRILYRYSQVFPASGTYTTQLIHAMRDSIVTDIQNVGITIETKD